MADKTKRIKDKGEFVETAARYDYVPGYDTAANPNYPGPQTGAADPSYSGTQRGYYEAYCFYIPTGMGEDFEKPLVKKLMDYGERKKELVLAAVWDPGKPSYNELLRSLGINAPAVVFSDSPNPADSGAFNIKVTNLDQIRDLDTMITEIPLLCQLIENDEYSEAVKKSIDARRNQDFKSLVRKVSSALKHVKITASLGGTSVSAEFS